MMMETKNIKVCGIDPHKRMCWAVIVNGKHSTKEIEFRFDNSLNGALELVKILRTHSCNTVVIENSNNFAYALHEFLTGADFTVELVGPAKVPPKNKKSDRIDAAWLAMMYLRDMVSPDYVPPKEIRQLRDLVRLRDLLVKQRTALKNNVHANLTRGLFDISQIVSDAFGKRGIKILETLASENGSDASILDLPEHVLHKYQSAVGNSFTTLINGVTLGIATKTIKMLNAVIKELEDTIALYVTRNEEIRRMVERAMSIDGVGLITAATIVAEVGEFKRFSSKKEISAWAGMTPDTSESNGKQISHGITKRGSPHIRRVLCEAANVIVLHGKPKGLYKFYKRIMYRKGRKVAIVALGHKLLRVIYTLITEDKEYEDETNNRDGARYRSGKERHNKKLRMLLRRSKAGEDVLRRYSSEAAREYIRSGMYEMPREKVEVR